MDVVASWTGERADALRQALRMTNEAFAGYLGVAVRTVASWRTQPDIVPRPSMQEVLDAALAQAPAPTRTQFGLILAKRGAGHAGPDTGASLSAPLDVGGLTTWITATNASDAAIEHIEQAALTLADRHTQAPARDVLADVLQLHGKTQMLLRGGRQRLRQTRELIRLDGSILAHASVLLGDLGQDQTAEDYGHAALLWLQEAEASQATAFYALAKTARWQHNYAAAADFAQQGFEHGPVTPMSVQLASYEANAAALLGDQARARHALARAESFAELLPARDNGTSPRSFPAGRQAIFKLSVLLRTGDPAGALRAAAAADERWATGDPRVPGTWAQVRTGAAIAHLLNDSLDGAAEQVIPVLALAPELRITTVTGWLRDLNALLARPRFASSTIAASLRPQIRNFNAGGLPAATDQEGG